MITDRTIINFLMWVGGLVLGCYLAMTTAAMNYYPLLLTVSTVFLVFAFVIVRDRMIALPFLASYIAGKFNFLPFGLTAADVGTVLLILYFLVTYIALKQRPINPGPLYFFLPVLIIFSIVLYHDHTFGLRSLGSTMEGSRPGVLMLLTAIAYVCGINTPHPPVSFLKNVPWFCLFIAAISAIPYIITSIFPGATPYVFIITTNVNADAYVESMTYSLAGSAEEIGRYGSLGAVGGTLMMCMLVFSPPHTWLRPKRWYIIILSLVCLLLVLLGGYRNGLVIFGLQIFIGIWCYYSWRSLVVIPLLVLVIFGLILGQQYDVLKLPLTVQRSLSFLPGKWDEDVVASTVSSDDFRENIKRVYVQEYLYKSPWFGNGLTWDAAKYDELEYLYQHQETPDHYYQSEFFITGKMAHTGWINLYDILGLVGGGAFVFLSLSMIWVSGRMVLRRDADRKAPLHPLKMWMFINCTVSLFSFFVLYGDVKSAFPSCCYSAIVLFHLLKLDRAARLEAGLPLGAQSFHQPGPRASLLEIQEKK